MACQTEETKYAPLRPENGSELSENGSERISEFIPDSKEKTPTHRHYWPYIVMGPGSEESLYDMNQGA
jgi:hypothetical protein